MTYATPTELRDRYRRGPTAADEFAAYEDSDLEQALVAASGVIDAWRPAGDLTAADLAVLKGQVLTLARAQVYHDQALGQDHPVVAEAAAARAWLKALASGTVRLPSAALTSSPAAPGTPLVSAPTEVFGTDFSARYFR